MNNQEFQRLLGFQRAKHYSFKPSVKVTSRRTAKSKANATGQILKNSRITSEVPLEKLFITRR